MTGYKDYNVKIQIKAVTSQDLEKILHFFHDADYWRPEDSTIEIETVEGENQT